MATARLIPSEIYAGDSLRVKLTLTLDDPSVTTIAGWDFYLTFKSSLDNLDADADIAVTTTAGVDPDDDPTNFIVYLTLTSAETKVPVGKYFYGVKRVIPGANPQIKTLEVGTIKIKQPALRDTP